MDELQGAVVCGSGFREAVQAAEQLGPRGVEVVVGIELERVGEGERRLEVAGLGDRDRPVELDDR